MHKDTKYLGGLFFYIFAYEQLLGNISNCFFLERHNNKLYNRRKICL